MAQRTDVFYGFCTFWTGDWDWLAEKIGAAEIPHCPHCKSVGFEMPREEWLTQARSWEDGPSQKAVGVPHPGFLAMLMWGEKQCFPTYAALEVAWRAAGAP